MNNHTPAPWEVDAMGNIWGKDTKVAEMSTRPSQDDFHYRRKSIEEHEANAEHIVKCVNYHDRLVDVVRRVHDFDSGEDGSESLVDQDDLWGEMGAILAQLSAHNGGEG